MVCKWTFRLPQWTGAKHCLQARSVTYQISWILAPSGLARSQPGRSPGDGKQVWKWTCSPSVPPSSLCCCNEEQWLYSWREGTPSDPHPTRPPPAHASPQWLCWQANRWLGWVASGLRALSVIKERKKVYGLLVSVPPTDGMSSKHPAIPNLWRDWGGGGRGLQSAVLKATYWPRYSSTVWLHKWNESNSTDVWIFMIIFT